MQVETARGEQGSRYRIIDMKVAGSVLSSWRRKMNTGRMHLSQFPFTREAEERGEKQEGKHVARDGERCRNFKQSLKLHFRSRTLVTLHPSL